MVSCPPLSSDWRPGDAADPDFVSIDGRRLAYATYGDPDGRPVLFMHGTPGSRLLGRLLDGPAAEQGVRLVRADALASMADGPGGVVRELGRLARSWPFALADVSAPVTVFQGRRDTNVAPSTGAELVATLPNASLERVEDDHLGTLCRAGSVLRSCSRRTSV